ncbi:MAG: LTA synthase family protein [Firmicutes bacterium]|nr:LTA synthase family protein [Candidatus Colimorpha enterica]
MIKKILPFAPFAVLAVLFALSFGRIDFEKVETPVGIRLSVMAVLTVSLFVIAVYRNKTVKIVFGSVLFAAVTPIMFYIQECFIHDPFNGSPAVKNELIDINLILIVLPLVVLAFAFSRFSAATAIVAAVTGGMGFANCLSFQFRGIPIYPWDFLSAGTAALVMNNYTVDWTFDIIFNLFITLYFVFAAILCDFRLNLGRWWIRTSAAVLTGVVLVGLCGWYRSDEAVNKYGYYPYLFSESYLYKYNGTPLTLVFTSKYLTVEKPDNYSVSEIKTLSGEYPSDSTEISAVKPNVIVIMNEAFSDPSVLGFDFTASEDYMPFIHSLEGDDTAKGWTHVSVLGGNTPNSEYEFLTGMTMGFLPAGSIPYQQFVKDECPNLVTQMEALGYGTVGMHAYSSGGWKRNVVYPLLGFDEVCFSNQMKMIERIRTYISDKSMFKNVISYLENSEKPLFLFGVTMQNHGGYTTDYDNFVPDVTVEGVKSKALTQYLSLMKKSDEAFEYLIDYIRENITEPTVVLMFGDHQANDSVVKPIYNLNGADYTTHIYTSVKNSQDRYITPYVLWANYDIDEEKMPEHLSLNYLASHLLSALGLPLTGYQHWQSGLFEKFPVIDAGCIAENTADGINYILLKRSVLTK